MIADLRKDQKFSPPLPQWLKWAFLLSIVCFILAVGFSYSQWQNGAKVRAKVQAQKSEIEKANIRIKELEAKSEGYQAGKIIKTSLDSWKRATAPCTALQAAMVLSIVDARESLRKSYQPAPATSNSRKGKKTGPVVEPPDLTLSRLTVDAHNDTGVPTIELTISHNSDGRLISNQISDGLKTIPVPNIQLSNFAGDDRGKELFVRTSWTKIAEVKK